MILGAKIDLKPKHLKFVNQLIHIYDFIEVYFTPDAVVDHNDALATHEKWIVHAPHHQHMVNLATGSETNKIVEKSIIFAGKLGAEYVIVHPGFLPKTELQNKESYEKNLLVNLKNLRKLCEKSSVQLLLENVPLIHEKNFKYIDLCSTPQEMKIFLKESGCGFVLDFPHAYHASVSHKIDYKKFILEFMKLKPKIFHLYDGRASEELDTHLAFGQGNLDIPFFVSLIGDNRVTLEISPPTVDAYVDAQKYLKDLNLQ
jgi:sugar phosphate isomerase/epimerase